MSLADLVQAKKTQRDKDWSMLRRLVEADYLQHRDHPSPEQIAFWLAEMRTPPFLIGLATRHPELAAQVAATRPALAGAIASDTTLLEAALAEEEAAEREADRRYWQPLRAELEALRREHR